MFERMSRVAERAVSGLSRRNFLLQMGRLGIGAFAFASFVGEAVAGGSSRWILNGGCCGGSYPYLLQEKVKGNWVNVGCTQNGGLVVVFCVPSPRCCGGNGYCDGAGTVCYSDPACTTAC